MKDALPVIVMGGLAAGAALLFKSKQAPAAPARHVPRPTPAPAQPVASTPTLLQPMQPLSQTLAPMMTQPPVSYGLTQYTPDMAGLTLPQQNALIGLRSTYPQAGLVRVGLDMNSVALIQAQSPAYAGLAFLIQPIGTVTQTTPQTATSPLVTIPSTSVVSTLPMSNIPMTAAQQAALTALAQQNQNQLGVPQAGPNGMIVVQRYVPSGMIGAATVFTIQPDGTVSQAMV